MFRFEILFSTTRCYNGNRNVFPNLFFSFQLWNLIETKLGPCIITLVFSFKYFLTDGGCV